jgi:hypothetical protein
VFSVLGGLGIGLWFLWNKLIFGDPLYFQKGVYSSQAQQNLELSAGKLFSYHNLWQAIRFYTIDSAESMGAVLLALAAIGLIWFVVHRKFTPLTLAGLLFAIPFPFYIAALYTGQAIIWVPGANPPDAHVFLYNVRYGSQMVIPAAFFFAILVERLSSIAFRRFYQIAKVLLVGLIIGQSLLIASQGIITLQEGQYNYSCAPQNGVVQYLAEHYNGGRILQDVYTSQFDASDAGIDFKNVVYEGSGNYWAQALSNPGGSVDWIIYKPTSPTDLVTRAVQSNPQFLAQFQQVAGNSKGVLLFYRKGGPPLANRPAPAVWKGPYYSC